MNHVDDGTLVLFPTGGHALVGRLDEVLEAGDMFLRSNADLLEIPD